MVRFVPEVAAAGWGDGVINALACPCLAFELAVVAEGVIQAVALGVAIPACRVATLVGADPWPLVRRTTIAVREYGAAWMQAGSLRPAHTALLVRG